MEGWIKGASAEENGNHSTDNLTIGRRDGNYIAGVGIVTIKNKEDGVDYSIGDISMHLGSIMQINFDATMQFNNYELIGNLSIPQGVENKTGDSYEYLFRHAGIDIATTYMAQTAWKRRSTIRSTAS